MFRWIAQNIRTFLWAFLLAVAVWIAAVTACDPDIVRVYPSPIPVEIIGQDPTLIITNTLPESIELTLRAPQSVWERLTADETSIRATIDLSQLQAGDHEIPIQVQIGIRPVQIVKIEPASTMVSLETTLVRQMPIDLSLSGEPAVGYKSGDPNIAPARVTITGPRSLVSSVAKIRATVHLDGARENIEESTPLQAVDEKNRPVSGVTLEPANALVSIPISQQGGYRDMAVKVVVTGQVASGYHLTSISVFPPVVTVFSSDPALINDLPGVVETESLDISGISNDMTTSLPLQLPEGISIVGEQSVTVQVSVEAIVSSLTLANQPILVENLEEGMSASISPETVDVILSGALPLLDTLSPQDVQVSVDVAGLDIGTHQLAPTVTILISNIQVESILPATVEVILGTATPTPSP